jgi:hypothetical protein
MESSSSSSECSSGYETAEESVSTLLETAVDSLELAVAIAEARQTDRIAEDDDVRELLLRFGRLTTRIMDTTRILED